MPKGSYGPYLRTLALTHEIQPEGTWTTPPTWKTSAGFPITISSISYYCKDAFFCNLPGMGLGIGAVPKGYGDKDFTKTARRVRA